MPYPSQIEPDSLGSLALIVVETKGWDSWSLRDVATAAGVTPNALYRHVDGKRGLDVAIAVAAARDLREALAVEESTAGSIEDITAVASRYLGFAADRPHAYRAFAEGKPLPEDQGFIEWLYLWADFRSVVQVAAPNAVDAVAFALWSYLHGRIELSRTAARMAPLDAGVDATIEAILLGYRGANVPSPLPFEIQELMKGLEGPRLKRG